MKGKYLNRLSKRIWGNREEPIVTATNEKPIKGRLVKDAHACYNCKYLNGSSCSAPKAQYSIHDPVLGKYSACKIDPKTKNKKFDCEWFIRK